MSEDVAAYRASVARYTNMNLAQLRKMCSQSWLSEEGSEEEMRLRLVEYDAVAEGWEIPQQHNSLADVSNISRTELEDVCLTSSSEDDDAPSVSEERSDRAKSASTPRGRGGASRHVDSGSMSMTMATPIRPLSQLRSGSASDSSSSGRRGLRGQGLRGMPSLSIEVDNAASPSTPAFGTPARSARSGDRPSMLQVQEEEDQEDATDTGCSDEDDGDRHRELKVQEREDSAAEQAEEWLRLRGLNAAAIQSIRTRFHESDIMFDVKGLQGLPFDELWQYAKSPRHLPTDSSKWTEREGQRADSVPVHDHGEEASEDEDVELFSSPPRELRTSRSSLVTPIRGQDDSSDDLNVQREDEYPHPQAEMSQSPISPRRRQDADTAVVQRGQPNLPRTLSPMQEYAASLRARESSESATIHDSQPDTDAEKNEEVSEGASTVRKGKGGARRWGRLSGRARDSSHTGTVISTGSTEEDDEDAVARAEAAALRARLLAERSLQTSGATPSRLGAEGHCSSTVQRPFASVKQPPKVPENARAALLSTPPPRRSRSRSSGASRTNGTPPLPNRDEDELEHQRQEERATDDTMALLVTEYFERYDVDLDGRLSSPTELGAALNGAYPELGLEAAELEELKQEAQAEVSDETSGSHSEGLSLEQFEFLIAGFATEMGPPKPLERLSRRSRQTGQRYISTSVINGFNI
eukprot:COSAG02_NODE_112_length_35994_cov_12.152695_19_plen_696_part_00